jgi:SAM-dependent methyltransferase
MDAKDWDARYEASARVWSATPNQFVESELADLGSGSALDLASGEGRNAVWLASLGWRVTAIDYSAVAIERAAQSGASVDWRVGDVLHDQLPVDQDLVLVSYLQLPSDQMQGFWPRAWAAVRRGGTLFVIAHDSSNLSHGVGGPQDPDCLYTAADVLSTLEGYEIIKAERVERATEAGTAMDALVRIVKR